MFNFLLIVTLILTMHCIHKALSNFTVFTHLFGTKPQHFKSRKILSPPLHPLWWTINNVNTALLNKSPSDENMCTADFENRQQLVR